MHENFTLREIERISNKHEIDYILGNVQVIDKILNGFLIYRSFN